MGPRPATCQRPRPGLDRAGDEYEQGARAKEAQCGQAVQHSARTDLRSILIEGANISQRANRTQAGSLCYATLTPSRRVYGDSFWDGPEKSLNSPNNQCSIDRLPACVLRTTERCFTSIRRSSESPPPYAQPLA
jgi:hypothetical protein